MDRLRRGRVPAGRPSGRATQAREVHVNIRPRMYYTLLLLAACLLAGLAGRVRAEDRHGDAQSSMTATFEVTFGTKPHWVGVPRTHVQEIREGERPDYDIFKCKGRYYVHKGDDWFVSKRSHGRFVAVEERMVPEELWKVPSNHWRNYPRGWADRKDKDMGHGKHHGDSGDDHMGH